MRAQWTIAVLLGSCLALASTASSRPLLRWNENAQVPAGSTVEDLVVIHGSADIAGKVNGNVIVLQGNVSLASSAYIAGDVVCLGGKITHNTGAVVVGSRVEIGGEIGWKSLPFLSIGKLLFLGFLYKLATAVIMLVLSLFLVFMWPNQIRCAAEEASHDLVRSCLVGLLATAILFPLAIGFAVTLFGIPISLAIVLFLLLAHWFGVTTIAYLIGHKMLSKFAPLFAVIIGLLLLKVVHFVPFIGGMLYFVAILPGLGAVLLTRFGTNQPWLKTGKARSGRS